MGCQGISSRYKTTINSFVILHIRTSVYTNRQKDAQILFMIRTFFCHLFRIIIICDIVFNKRPLCDIQQNKSQASLIDQR